MVIITGDNKDSTGLILLGILIGVLAFALLSKKTTQTLSAQPTPQQQPIQINWQPIDIPRADDINLVQTVAQPQIQSQTDFQLSNITSQLHKATSQLEQATTRLQELEQTVFKLQNHPSQLVYPPPQYVILQPQTISQPPQSPQVVVQPLPAPQQQQAKVQPIQQDNLQSNTQSNTLYKNDEKWEIRRGPDGRIKSINIIRDVKKNN